MGFQVNFVFEDWAVAFPEFRSVPPGVAAIWFGEAETIHANDGSGPVSSATQQTALLYLLTAHIAKLRAYVDGQKPSDLVGRISDAAEGSVHVSAEYADPTQANAFFNQTRYGAQYWQAASPYRTAVYVPGPTRNFDRFFPPFRNW